MSQTKHTYKTRLLHSMIAVLITVQLYTIYALDNRFFTKPIRSFLFSVHTYSGIVAFCTLLLFWIVIITRRQGTSFKELFPWVSISALKNLFDDCVYYLKSLCHFKIPEHRTPAPLASAIHGLGIIIMSIMAITGVHRYIVYQFAITKTPLIKAITSLHGVFGDYAWIYLGVHASIALINHIAKKQKLSAMWSFKK
jgi:cytochrome b561